ncbi:MAG TPA: PadR family transcriptional regulator [Caulobacteraceae bacterium]|jgi:DNA-binding PadR family transcriptional regulator
MHRFRFHSRAAQGPDWRGHSGRDFAHALARHAWREHGRGRRGRVFEQGDLRLVLLRLIADKPSHGYELIKAVEEKFGGGYSPSPGVIYPTLTLLEEIGQIRAVQAEGSRKAFEITDEGRAALEENRGSVDGIFRRMSEAAERLGASPPHQILRAMENLRLALRLRLERGKLTDAVIADVAAALDAAAQTLDRD